jgi:hypothetical protein
VHYLNQLCHRHIAVAIAFSACLTCATLATEPVQSGAEPDLFKPVMPTIPESVSRPSNWPTNIPATLSKHVLSSILYKPGAPLEPVDEDGNPLIENAEAKRDENNSSNVILADYEEIGPANVTDLRETPIDDIPGMKSIDMAQVVARVGPEVVLAGDLMTPAASEWLNKVSPGLQEEQVAELRLKIYQQVIGQHLETLLVYVDACRMIPEENLPEIREKVNEAFDQEQLPRMVQAAGVGSVREYEQLLRSQGQSLERMRKMFFERALAQEWLQQNANTSGEIPHAEMIAWYQNHLDEYEFQAKVKFEQMTVKVNQKQPRNQAWNRLAAMGNDVLNGRSFSEVAKESSEGPTASQGGLYEWTTQGSLVSEVIDNAIFSLPVGELSAILDDHQALHIVRVLERSDAGRTPFVEAQVAIRMELRRQQQESTRKEYLDRLKNRTPIWTVFDDKQKNTRLAENPSTTR